MLINSTPRTYIDPGGVLMLSMIPWRLIIWSGAGLVAVYFIGWELFGPHRRARNLLVNGVSGLSAAWAASTIGGFFGAAFPINLAMIACSVAFGIPGAALVCVLQLVLRA